MEIRIGDKVRSKREFDNVTHEGIVKDIVLTTGTLGFIATLYIQELVNGEPEKSGILRKSSAEWWERVSGSDEKKDENEGEAKNPFPPEVLALNSRFHQAIGPQAKEDLLVEMAQVYLKGLHSCDYKLPEFVFKDLQEVRETQRELTGVEEKLKFTYLKIARTLVNAIDLAHKAMELYGLESKKPGVGLVEILNGARKSAAN